MELLEGRNDRVILKIESDKKEDNKEEEGKEEITREDLMEIVRKMKRAKAPGENGIENEAWRYMSKEIGEELWKLINKIWKGEGIPKDWNRGIICPIYKKGEKDEPKNYRGITFMDTAYKTYANLLNARLGKEVENKLKETQLGKREERLMQYTR